MVGAVPWDDVQLFPKRICFEILNCKSLRYVITALAGREFRADIWNHSLQWAPHGRRNDHQPFLTTAFKFALPLQ